MKLSVYSFSAVLLGLLIGCSEQEEKVKINNIPPTVNFRIVETADQFTLDGSLSIDPDGDSLTYKWSTTGLLTIASPSAPKTFFSVPNVAKSFTAEVKLELKDGINTVYSTQSVLIPAFNQMVAYGLGTNLIKSISNNTNYYWYYDQANSGTYSSVNCGPTSVSMAIKWTNEFTNSSPIAARNTYRSEGGWWLTFDIINYLKDNNVTNSIISLSSIDILKDKIDNGKIIILCLDMYYVQYQTNDAYHHSKFYSADSPAWGHFIVVKGYKEVDNQTFFETYDPYSYGERYADNSLKGKDRYYKAADLDLATNNWWDYAIVISKSTSGGRAGTEPDAVDPSTIIHKSGR
jgi:Peptidase_C39 like family